MSAPVQAAEATLGRQDQAPEELRYGGFLESTEAAARVAADAVVLSADPDAAAANPFYWHQGRPWYLEVVRILAEAGPEPLRHHVEQLQRAPGDAMLHHEVRLGTAAFLRDGPGPARRLLTEALGRVRARSRVGYHPGAGVTAPGPGQNEPEVWPQPPAPRVGAAPDARVTVVIPFRDRDGSHRLRNLQACLSALGDQSLAREDYRVVVVESDASPRWRELIGPQVDEYHFAYNAGPFNKSWAVNVGVVQSRHPSPAVCVLDADALVDRGFLARNLARFARPALGAFMPFQDVLYLDAPSTVRAVRQRCLAGDGAPDQPRLRGFVVHRSPGICVFTRRDVFDAVDGLDERYESWGGEDLDFILRLQTRTAFHGFSDPMLHLHHPVRGDALDATGNTANKRLQPLTWRPVEPLGMVEKYARSARINLPGARIAEDRARPAEVHDGIDDS
ncbi:glycosyltransferase [Actinospica durhamensis]|uniref:Glycosyltransferase n=1 Tax=Actinospica durhamensis TaxID=1508375 RepID=A0A941EM38_9ACTN|nr:galactosyltransferase-related protein [Actinospica durhamensis]MBR7833470.1 glycosyltransferase [Actinospica durhamensis]